MATVILELAEQLGKAIQESPQAAKLRLARKELESQKDVLETLKHYQQQAQKMHELEEQQKPIEVADKQSLQQLHQKLIASDVFKKFTGAQVEYVDLMRQVSDTLRKQLADTEKM